MSKLLLEVYLPACGSSYEMHVPKQLKVAQVTDLIREFVIAKDDGEYVPTEEAALCDGKTGNIFPPNQVIGRLGLMNGSRIMLI